MLKERAGLCTLVLAGLLAIGAAGGPVLAQKTAAPKTPDKLALGEQDVRRLLPLMESKNGKVSKQEFMAFMEAEFDRLDKNKSGELDIRELTAPKTPRQQPSNATIK
jgi:hypothetical protein